MCCAVFVDGTISATICATAICGRAFAPLNVLLDKWFDWMLSDAGAAILLTPFRLLCWARPSILHVILKQPGVFLISAATSVMTVAYLLFGTTGIALLTRARLFWCSCRLWMAVRLSLRVPIPFVVVML
jgi:hypothetical protein